MQLAVHHRVGDHAGVQDEAQPKSPSGKVNRDRPSARLIRAARDHREWSQRRLAEETGLDRDEIYRYEAGMHGPSGAAALRLVDALPVPSAVMIAALDGDVAATDAYIMALAADSLSEEPPESEELDPP